MGEGIIFIAVLVNNNSPRYFALEATSYAEIRFRAVITCFVRGSNPLTSVETALIFDKKVHPAQKILSIPESGLSVLLNIEKTREISPLECGFARFCALTAATALSLRISVFLGGICQTILEIQVLPITKVFHAIGYLLWQYYQLGHEPKLSGNEQNPGFWTLRVMDEGEFDNDFPALDRNRPISRFSFNEFALVQATLAQSQENLQNDPLTAGDVSLMNADFPKEELFQTDQNESQRNLNLKINTKLHSNLNLKLNTNFQNDKRSDFNTPTTQIDPKTQNVPKTHPLKTRLIYCFGFAECRILREPSRR